MNATASIHLIYARTFNTGLLTTRRIALHGHTQDIGQIVAQFILVSPGA